MRKRTGALDGARRAAASFSVVLLVAPKLERDGNRRLVTALSAEMGRDSAVNASAHRDQHAACACWQLSVGCNRATERAGQRVGSQLGGVNLAGAQPSELSADIGRAYLRCIQHRYAINKFDGGACCSAGSAATRRRKGRFDDPRALNSDCDPYEVAAGCAPGHAAVRAWRHISLPARVAQMVLKTLVSH